MLPSGYYGDLGQPCHLHREQGTPREFLSNDIRVFGDVF